MILKSYKYNESICTSIKQRGGGFDSVILQNSDGCWIHDKHGTRHFKEKKHESDMSFCPWEDYKIQESKVMCPRIEIRGKS